MTLDLKQLAIILHVDPRTLRNQLSARPEIVPPPIRIPGTRRLLWLEEDVKAWLTSHRSEA